MNRVLLYGGCVHECVMMYLLIVSVGDDVIEKQRMEVLAVGWRSYLLELHTCVWTCGTVSFPVVCE